MDKLLTIAIPTYKKSRELKRALEALALQYDKRLEIIVSDDASPDNTAEVVAEIQNRVPIIYIRNEKNLGYDRNYMQCYRKATGKYVMLMGNDDFMMDGGVAYILDYLEKHSDIDWVYVNYRRFFEKEGKPYFEGTDTPIIDDMSNISKKKFISYTSIWVSTLTSVVRRDKVMQISDYSEFYDTYFLAIGIPFTITKPADSHLGIIGKPLIAYNAPRGEKISDKYFKIFGTGLRYIMCEVGPKCGYDSRTVRKAYKDGFMTWGTHIVQLRAEKSPARRNLFWSDGFNAVKDYPSAWVTVIPLALLPRFVALFLLNYVRPLYHRLKNIKYSRQ